MRNGRAVIGPNDIHIKLSPEDISMFNGTIDQIEDLFVALKKANPKWEAEIKAQEAKARHASCNYGNGNGNDIPTGPKRPREEDDVHERDRLDRELDRDRDRDDWRDAWQPQQFDRGRQFDRQRNFANQGFDRHDNPKRRR
jgi:hypothetical protein